MYVKPEAASAVLGLLMMSSMSLETCRASYKHRIINSDTLLHLVGYFCMNCMNETKSIDLSWVLAPCRFVSPYQHLGGTDYLSIQGLRE